MAWRGLSGFLSWFCECPRVVFRFLRVHAWFFRFWNVHDRRREAWPGAAGCFWVFFSHVFFSALQDCVLGAQNTLPPISGVGWNY